MSCRATGCDKREWMARKFCDRHWKMLPLELQIRIRKTLERRRGGQATAEELQPLVDEAQSIITAAEMEAGVAAEINLFRTHMASVAGTVAALRTIPLRDLHAQLTRSRDAQIATDPAGAEELRPRIALDLELLAILGDTSEQLRDAIKKYAPAPVEEPDLQSITKEVRECELCGNSGFVEVPHVEQITHDMAVDAGSPEMEGQEMSWGNETVPCPNCNGEPPDLVVAT